MLGQRAFIGLDRHLDATDAAGQAGQAVGQAKIVQDRRAQAGDGGPRLIQGQVDHLPGQHELLGGERGRVVQRVGSRVQVIGQADQPLRDAVVDIAGQPPPFCFLRGDHPLGELLKRMLARGQPAVQPGLVDRPALSGRESRSLTGQDNYWD